MVYGLEDKLVTSHALVLTHAFLTINVIMFSSFIIDGEEVSKCYYHRALSGYIW